MSIPNTLKSIRDRRAAVEAKYAAWQDRRDRMAAELAEVEANLVAEQCEVEARKAAFSAALTAGDPEGIDSARRAMADPGPSALLASLESEANMRRAAMASVDLESRTFAEQSQRLAAEERALCALLLRERAAEVSRRQREHVRGLATVQAEAVAMSRLAEQLGGDACQFSPPFAAPTLMVSGVGADRSSILEPVADKVPAFFVALTDQLRAEGWSVV